ncbi:MAG: glycosyltransferase family 2 protein [Planktomarina sp.]|nr:glycosyltransferase family 2 protein [Planktomarina sp.]MDG1295428.1 glycosyltransferase family 2 protein [Planktomarina sp.]
MTNLRNAAPFIVQWVPHMGAIGATDLLAYTNDCDDFTDALLAVLAKHGALHISSSRCQTG